MTGKGCDNCHYSFFDERAYPCSLCIRGIERTDQWQPSKKTKADRKTEPQTEMPRCSVNGTPYDECGFCEYFNCDTCKCEADVPQTERSSE